MSFSALLMRYQNDAEFHQLVNCIEKVIDETKLTADDVLSAAEFAYMLWSHRHPDGIKKYMRQTAPLLMEAIDHVCEPRKDSICQICGREL